ncbi:MAG: hypothetical protein JRJ17_07030 [Deltaproteobacteria bacterium]|nr:hypothetical protein [Deltaproteobacteria bacterium]
MKQDKALNVAIVGGGSGCKAIMDMILAEKLSRLHMKLIGVADSDQGAPGHQYARKQGIYTTNDYHDLYELEDLNLIIELVGDVDLADEILRTKPDHVRLMDNIAARLFWDVFQIEEQRVAERKRAEEVVREKQRFLQAVFDAIQDGITVLDCDLNVILANLWMEKMFSDQMPLVGKKCYNVYHKRETPCPG